MAFGAKSHTVLNDIPVIFAPVITIEMMSVQLFAFMKTNHANELIPFEDFLSPNWNLLIKP